MDHPTSIEVATRQCGAEDLFMLEALAQAALDEVTKWRGGELVRELIPAGDLAAQLSRCIGSELHVCRLGTLDRVVVAAAVAGYLKLASGNKLAQVKMLYVLPQARKVGVGEKLIGDLLSWATAQNCTGIEATALPGDRLTKNFFESQEMVARSLTLYRDLV